MRKDITVVAKMKSNGDVEPLSIIWEDGKTFNIDKILDKRKRASTKGGGKGLRYTVRTQDKERFLFLDEYTWFVEVEE